MLIKKKESLKNQLQKGWGGGRVTVSDPEAVDH